MNVTEGNGRTVHRAELAISDESRIIGTACNRELVATNYRRRYFCVTTADVTCKHCLKTASDERNP